MASGTSNSSCYQCSSSSTSTQRCATCNRHFCPDDFRVHRDRCSNYPEDGNQRLSIFFNEFKRTENKLRAQIDQCVIEQIHEVHKSADQARHSLDAYINSYRTHFNEELSSLRTTHGDLPASSLETLQMECQRLLNDLYLVKSHAHETMFDIKTKHVNRELELSHYPSQESDLYIAQTVLGDRLLREPLAEATSGSYWAMAGSGQHLLIQEYETEQLILFDCRGTRSISIVWPRDLIIRDIIWHEESRRFFIFLDKKLILFDPLTRNVEENHQVKPYQSNIFRRCACHEQRLFISHWGHEGLIELIRIDTWETEQRWSSPVTCQRNELITSIRMNTIDQLGLCIQDESNPLQRKFRFEIRDLALNILHRLPLEVDSGIFSRMTSLPDLHWALLNVDENFIFIVDQHGHLIDRLDWPRGPVSNIALVGTNFIVIRTRDNLYFYDVEFHTEHT